MKFTYIANACGVFTFSEGTRLLMDPWLNDGVFEEAGVIIHPSRQLMVTFKMLMQFIFRMFIQIITMTGFSITPGEFPSTYSNPSLIFFVKTNTPGLH